MRYTTLEAPCSRKPSHAAKSTMLSTPISLPALNALDRDAFVAAVGHVFEHSPWIAAEAWAQRPFADLAALHGTLVAVVAAAGEERQLALIRAHPDLAGRIALAGQLTPASAGEQAAAGLSTLNADELARFTAYNAAYRERFGFPFVICARANKQEAILAAFPLRLGHTRDQEIRTALGEIAQIAWLRLSDCVIEA
jgi:2-oxo-4-hydroxy-4-carboxy-5-ureidoimidazoline decarboxylase